MSVRLTAPAKINLSLRVLGKRTDGFHEIRTIFQALDLGDEVTVSRRAKGLELEVRGPDIGPDEENLAYRAAKLFLEASGETQGVKVVLTKWIPAGAGLGGGSSDAAAVLKALAWLSPFPPSPTTLMSLGARLGSDVPFFLGDGPLAHGAGRGEVLRPIPALPPAHLVLALPDVHVSTAHAYAALGRRPLAEDEDGRKAEADAAGKADDGHAPTPVAWEDLMASLQNDFEPVVSERHPEVRRSLDALREAGSPAVSLSGSGAACFGFFPDRAAAERAADALTLEVGWPFVAARTRARWPEPVSEPTLGSSEV